ncbi:glycoside hydrolase family 78 protein [Paenibacillus sp. MMS18-CY102]|uniref:glycoside hydrolase family 78 protein n=1 Tax=Paenibacillus sp. MMS18-CY102 TaxID=2682849 RepID=UPI0013658A22|nr:hypothetical protein [Paenibacillus sp. MMS18-CY102]MWC30699.1 hypothetical protein [Paenibacillus sp. MMS18-CY102]
MPGNPPDVDYDGTYDIYHVNLYYKKVADPTAYIRHVDRAGKPIPGLADREEKLEDNKLFNPKHTAAPNGYTYAGYAKTTTGTPPTDFTSPAGGEYPSFTYTGGFKTLYLYYVYDRDGGTAYIRHVDRSGNPIPGLTDRSEPLELSKLFNSKSTPPPTGYTYDGYVKTTTGIAPTDFTNPAKGEYPGFTYNGSFKILHLTYVYSSSAINFTGDFDVIRPTISYRDSFKLHPRDFSLKGCTYQGHQWKIVRNGVEYTSPIITSQTTDTTYGYSNYPSVIGVGAHQIYMKIYTANCGNSDWIGPKTLEVDGPSNNKPPEFKIAWVRPSDPLKPVTQAVEGEVLSIAVIQDPSVPTPNDPDGDTLTFGGFTFSSDWGKQIPSKYAEGWMAYNNVTMDTLGTHSVSALMRDPFGATATAYTSVNVVPINPIPVIEGPDKVVEGRPLPSGFHADKSYSPVGRMIDHPRDEWTNKKALYATPGKEIIKLNVYDNMGLKSLEPAQHVLTVLEDLPPVVDLKGALTAVRNITYPYTGTAVSPDGDKIISVTIKRAYDSNNDGSFANETKSNLTISPAYAFSYAYPKVGKYLYTICATEDWGKSACKDVTVDVVNDSPTVSFEVSSAVTEPPLYVPVPISPSDIVSGADWKNTDTANLNKPKAWSVSPSAVLGSIAYNSGDHTITGAEHSNYRALSMITETQYAESDDRRSVLGYNNNNRLFVEDPVTLGDGYYAYNAGDSGSSMILIYHKNTPSNYQFVRYSGISNGFSWYSEEIYAVDLYHGKVVTYIKSNNYTSKYAVYTMDSFTHPAGQPYELLSSYVVPKSASNVGQYQKRLSGSYVNFESSTDANGKYITTYPWGSPISGTKKTGNCIVTLNCVYGGNYIPVKQSSYFGRYAILSDGGTVGDGPGLYIVDPAQFTSRKVAGEGSIRFAPGNAGWLLSKDEQYLLHYRSGNYWGVMDLASGVITQSGIGPNYKLLSTFNDYVAFLDQSNNRIVGYKLGKTLTQLWSTSNHFAAINSADPATQPVTADGFMYFYDINFTLMTLDLRTGQMRSLGSIPRGNASTINRIRVIADDKVEIQMRSSGTIMTAWMSGTPRASDTSPVGTQNQLMSSTNLANVQFTYATRLNEIESDHLYSGFAYRMADNESMYRVEMNSKIVRLVKVANGARTVIKEAAFAVSEGVWTSFKIVAQDDRHKVYANGVPLIDITDAYLKKGYFGPYSEIPKTEFKSLTYADMDLSASSAQYSNIAIAGGDVKYNDYFDDPENDPAIQALTKWTYAKIAEKFLDASDGKSGASAMTGKTYTKPQMPFDKVGLYRISYASTDDPHPNHLYTDMAFAAYRKESNEYTADVIVHRRPIAQFALLQQPDGKITWTDFSRDPDRYLSATNYSSEATGIDYYKTRGVLEKKFYYITPNGKMVKEKLVAPQEAGDYEIGMAVRDEYGAWSDYFVVNLTADKVAPANTPPVPGFTSSYINTFRGVPITFNSTAYDNEDGGRENLAHEYYVRNLTMMSTESLQSNSRTTWIKTFHSIGTFNIRQVIEDKDGVSAQYQLQVGIHNRVPSAVVVTPESSDQSKPTKFDTLRPAFKWAYSDKDGDVQKQYQMRIYRYGGILQADTNTRTGTEFMFIPNADLPEKINMYIVVRVYDGYDWSDWSDPKYFYIETNQPPLAAFDWSPKPVWEGDELKIMNRSTDPDGDTLTSKWTVVSPSNEKLSFSNDPVLTNVTPGRYQITLMVDDGQATATVTHPIEVLPLSIEADVNHTGEWKVIHDQKGHETGLNPKDFYAGETILANANTTPGAEVARVTARLSATGLDGNDLTRVWEMKAVKGKDRFAADLLDDRWASLKEGMPLGEYSFVFMVEYTNGVRKTTEVPFHIVGSVYETVQVHRRQ